MPTDFEMSDHCRFWQELVGECTTIEYLPPQVPSLGAPTFVFVVDTVIIDEELQQIKDSLIQSLMLLPPDALVGLITFGKNVRVATYLHFFKTFFLMTSIF